MSVLTIVSDKKAAIKERKRQNKEFQKVMTIMEKEGMGAANQYMDRHPNSIIDSIIIYPTKRVLSAEEMTKMEEGIRERENYWTREKLREAFQDRLDEIPAKFHDDIIETFFEGRAVFCINNDCLRNLCSDVIYEAEYPKSLSLHVSGAYSGQMSRLINGRLQRNMIRQNQLVPSDQSWANY